MLEADFRLSLNKDLDVLSASDRVEGLLGYASQDFLSAKVSIEKILHLNDAAKVRHIFDPAVKKQSGELNVRFRHADGRIRGLSRYTAALERGASPRHRGPGNSDGGRPL